MSACVWFFFWTKEPLCKISLKSILEKYSFRELCRWDRGEDNSYATHMHCNKIKILVCTENFLAYLLIFWTKMAYSSLKDYFKLYKIYCKIKTENFFRPKKIVRLILTKFSIVLLDRLPKIKIVLLDRLLAKLSC